MQRVATIHQTGKDLTLVIFDHASEPDYFEADGGYSMWVVEGFEKPGQRLVREESFVSLEDAIVHGREIYGVEPGTWVDAAPKVLDFKIAYKLTRAGVPQPVMMDMPTGTLVFRTVRREHSGEEEGLEDREYELEICGDREGLRRLAAWLLVCAESEGFDPEYHVHLLREGVAGNTEVTVRGPGYLERLRGH